jgi:hypothetical protein
MNGERGARNEVIPDAPGDESPRRSVLKREVDEGSEEWIGQGS